MKAITPDGVIHGNFGMLLEITDAELSFIEEHPERLLTLEVMMQLMKSTGHNAHIISLTLTDEFNISRYMKLLLTQYDSVSWFNREHVFHIKRNVSALMN